MSKKIREGLEAFRDYNYDKYFLTKGTNLHIDMEKLFNNFSSMVFDYTKIPEEDSDKLEKIMNYLRDSVLLAVKFGILGTIQLVIRIYLKKIHPILLWD